MVVPGNKTYFLSPLVFKGPCNSPLSIQVQIDGNLLAPNNPSEWKGCVNDTWIGFSQLDNVKIYGVGKINGRGSPWWKNGPRDYMVWNQSHDIIDGWNQKKDINICSLPASMKFNNCNNFELRGLTFVDPPNNHISLNSCNNFGIQGLVILAPKDSPHTDGIDITSSTSVFIKNSTISTGDDCIAVTSGCSNILVERVNCGPGHGISVGSLGKNGSYNTVEGVIVQNCILNETNSGARIKTWQGGRGYARNITFQDIQLINVQYPIIIDQNYFCKVNKSCNVQPINAVQVSDVKYINVRGTSSTMEAIRLDCSENVPCNNIIFDRTNISKSSNITSVYATCNNAKVLNFSETYPKLICK